MNAVVDSPTGSIGGTWRRWRNDFTVLRAMARGMPDEGSHGDRLAAFYAPQAEHYDRFRERLLRGRRELIADIQLPAAAHVVELGGGTGQVCEMFGSRLARVRRYDVVDLCEPLLARAQQRSQRIPALRPLCADATRWQPERPVDVVIVSYALTMIPDWRGAIDNARRMLAPGGQIAVVDFHTSLRKPAPGWQRHSAVSRAFWSRWFARDGVHLNPELLPTLATQFPDHAMTEAHAPVPYLPGLRVPYFRFVGIKP